MCIYLTFKSLSWEIHISQNVTKSIIYIFTILNSQKAPSSPQKTLECRTAGINENYNDNYFNQKMVHNKDVLFDNTSPNIIYNAQWKINGWERGGCVESWGTFFFDFIQYFFKPLGILEKFHLFIIFRRNKLLND